MASSPSSSSRSLACERKEVKYAAYEDVSLEDRQAYFRVSCYPLTKQAEDDMELLSDIVTWGEEFLHHWEKGKYHCARCSMILYSSEDKWKGPCVWPSFRKDYPNHTLRYFGIYIRFVFHSSWCFSYERSIHTHVVLLLCCLQASWWRLQWVHCWCRWNLLWKLQVVYRT